MHHHRIANQTCKGNTELPMNCDELRQNKTFVTMIQKHFYLQLQSPNTIEAKRKAYKADLGQYLQQINLGYVCISNFGTSQGPGTAILTLLGG